MVSVMALCADEKNLQPIRWNEAERGIDMITTITKRDGRVAYFDINKIANAIEKAFRQPAVQKAMQFVWKWLRKYLIILKMKIWIPLL